MLIGITGGIGSGKTALSNLLRAHGYLVYDSDKEARRLQNEHPEIRSKIIELFGSEIYNANGLNRCELAKHVFGNAVLLVKLNAIVHPVVMDDLVQWKCLNNTQKLLFVESAILFESGFDIVADKVLVVTASKELRVKRIVKRDGCTPEHALARMAAQISEEEKVMRANIVLSSDDNKLKETDIPELILRILELNK